MEAPSSNQWNDLLSSQTSEELKIFLNNILQRSDGLNLPRYISDIPLRPAIFTQSKIEELKVLSQKSINLCEFTLNKVLRKNVDFEKYFGFDENIKKFMSHRQYTREAIHQIGRPDIIFHKGQPKILEINAHTSIGGMPECDLMNHSYLQQSKISTLFKNHHLISKSPLVAMSRFLLSKGKQIGITDRPPTIALIEWEYDVEMNHLYSTVLSRLGLPTIFAHPDLLSEKNGYLYYGPQKIDIALRNISLDAWNPIDDFVYITEYLKGCEKGGTLIISDERTSLISNKSLFAEMYTTLSTYSPHDSEFIRQYLPWSSFVAKKNVTFNDQQVSMNDLMDPRHKSLFVIKKGRGEGGEGVYIGHKTTETDWENLIAQAWNNPQYLVQEYFNPDKISLPYLEDDKIIFQNTAFVLGQYIVDNELISPLIRLDKGMSNDVINHAKGAIVSTCLMEAL